VTFTSKGHGGRLGLGHPSNPMWHWPRPPTCQIATRSVQSYEHRTSMVVTDGLTWPCQTRCSTEGVRRTMKWI